ncbi:MAG TPA: hypothetical protein VE913_11610, partial [Longimicrobium sp.]|nr:hypothetical protein [Longimicrobium sp.]
MKPESMYANIRPEDVASAELAAAVRVLHEATTPEEVVAAAEGLLADGGEASECAVMDAYSYSQSVGGNWLATALRPLSARLTARARALADHVWSGTRDCEGDLRDRVLASCAHMFWRGGNAVDQPRVLRALAEESHWRILAPAISGVWMLRGVSPEFDRESSRLLARVARRDDLSDDVRWDAISTLGSGGAPRNLEIVLELMRELPHPMSAMAGVVLLEKDAPRRNLADLGHEARRVLFQG